MTVKADSNLLMQILERTPASHNIMLMGKHGIGKSQILEKYFSGKGYKVVTLFLGQMSDPGDLIGIPHKDEAGTKTDFLPPYWFPTDGQPIVLFLDELNRARPEVLQTIMDLALNRKLAGKSLPEGSRVISAVNFGEEYQLTELDPALVSRFNIYEFVPSVSDWILWAQKNGVDERITDFISAEPNMLDNHINQDNLDNLDKTCDRRAWVRVSDIIKGTEEIDGVTKSIIAGIVGSMGANHFCEYLSKNRLLTAGDLLLGNWDSNLKKLKGYGTPQFALLNDSIFAFLEVEKQKGFEEFVRENLNNYHNFLLNNSYREASAHFANMFSSNIYPKALVFLITECPEIYGNMMEFVNSIK